MSNNAPVITRDRLLAILDAYGATPLHWPAAERNAARDALYALRTAGDDRALEAALSIAAALDERFAEDDADSAILSPARQAALGASVLAALPRPRHALLLNARGAKAGGANLWPGWAIAGAPAPGRVFRRSAIAALLLLSLGFVGGYFGAHWRGYDSDIASAEFLALAEEWADGGDFISAAGSVPVRGLQGGEAA